MGHLYKLTFENGKAYIGISAISAEARFRNHKKAAPRGNTRLYRAWRKYGQPEMTLLAVVNNLDLAATEIRAIASFKTYGYGGYNMTPGGDTSPTLNPEVARNLTRRMKISLAHKGTTHSDARRFANAERMTDRFSDPAERAKQSLRMTGKRHSASTIEKMSKSQLLRFVSETARAKQAAIASQKWADPEFRSKVAVGHAVRRLSKPIVEMTKALMERTSQILNGQKPTN